MAIDEEDEESEEEYNDDDDSGLEEMTESNMIHDTDFPSLGFDRSFSARVNPFLEADEDLQSVANLDSLRDFSGSSQEPESQSLQDYAMSQGDFYSDRVGEESYSSGGGYDTGMGYSDAMSHSHSEEQFAKGINTSPVMQSQFNDPNSRVMNNIASWQDSMGVQRGERGYETMMDSTRFEVDRNPLKKRDRFK